jgi:hypothetical protein
MVCLPKSEGGLGVLNLESHNEALLLKNLHKFFNKEKIPWVQIVWEKYYPNGKLPNHTLKGSFWWRDILRLLNRFKSFTSVLVHKGNTCFLWHDQWGGSIHSQDLPELYSFARSKHVSVAKANTIEDLAHLFNLPLSQEAFAQLLVLATEFEEIQFDEEKDVWSYSWGSPFYSSMKAYKLLIVSRQVHPCYSWLWKAAAQKKHKVLFWPLLKDKLSTRNILRRKNKELPSYDCVLCNLQTEETLEHLFLLCPFAVDCWHLLQLIVPQVNPFDILSSFRNHLNVVFFMDIIILMCWSIWMTRNDFIFRGQQPIVQETKVRFKLEFTLVIHRAKERLKHHMSSWLEALV